ncbi:MAG: ABC transporter permease [Spirochaetes bacterium]|nr:ABC transporter permease [Spirochaetota bacterium]
MNNNLLLAVRNLLRYKRRTILTFLVLSFGVAMYVFQISFLKGFTDKSLENMINFETGHAKIRSLTYDDNEPYAVKNIITNSSVIKSVLKKKKYVKGYTERLMFIGELDNSTDSVPCIAVGIDIKTDKNVFSLTQFISKGSIKTNGAVIGYKLAEDLKVGVGDSLYLTFRTEAGMIDSVSLEITGLINSSDPKANTSNIYMNIDIARKILRTNGVTDIAFKVADYMEIDSYIMALKKSLAGYSFWSWKKLGDHMLALSKSKSMGNYFFVIFLTIIAVVGVINTMLMSVFEKKKEIGTLKALGMRDKDIKRIFLIEGSLIGGLGSLIGIIAGSLITWYFVENGLDLVSMMGDIGKNVGFRVMGVVKARWSPSSIVMAFVMSILVTTLASFYPAKKAVKLDASECLRTIQ